MLLKSKIYFLFVGLFVWLEFFEASHLCVIHASSLDPPASGSTVLGFWACPYAKGTAVLCFVLYVCLCVACLSGGAFIEATGGRRVSALSPLHFPKTWSKGGGHQVPALHLPQNWAYRYV